MKKSLVLAAAVGLVLVASVAIWMGSGDDSRRQGALGGEEPVTLSWHGEWSTETEYARGSVVTNDGTSYVAEGEGEKLSEPTLDCSECGWTRLAVEDASAAKTGESAPGYEIRGESSDMIAPNGFTEKATLCPLGKKVLGGGYNSIVLQIEVSQPVDPDDVFGKGRYGWRVGARNPTSVARSVSVYAICANLD